LPSGHHVAAARAAPPHTHRASSITDAAWLSAGKNIGWQIGLTRRVQMLKTPRITMPVTCGLIRSAILLPADADDWPNERRQVVLVHELAHVRRWDCLTQLTCSGGLLDLLVQSSSNGWPPGSFGLSANGPVMIK